MLLAAAVPNARFRGQGPRSAVGSGSAKRGPQLYAASETPHHNDRHMSVVFVNGKSGADVVK